MSLAPGDKLGPYEIVTPIGAGAMGEVYRARDTRLNRDVAVKVSNEHFTERFTREAHAIAALNHTNICHVYDVGPNYLVMELVEGDTLGGPIDFDEAIPIIRQLIDGIEAAHDKNIVHRDLKPANIKITPEGCVKILDFGLAHVGSDDHSESDFSDAPTLSVRVTQAGMLIGTAPYMSPEQAKGKQADKRSDIWSFGVVVYELLTGRTAFNRTSVVETLAAVINEEPDWSPVPPQARPLLEWCLEKDRKKRLASIGDARRLLEDKALSAAATRSSTNSQPRRNWLWPGAAILMLLIAGGGMYRLTNRSVIPPNPISFSISGGGAAVTLFGEVFPYVAVSPDGQHLAFVAPDSSGRPALFVRAINSFESQRLEGTEGARAPFWSPDSRQLAFVSESRLFRISISGGRPQLICYLDGLQRGGTWNKEDVILFALSDPGPSSQHGMWRVSALGGTPQAVLSLSDDTQIGGPQFLPDGRRFLYWLNAKRQGGAIFVGSLDSKQSTRLFSSDTQAEFAPPDKLLFTRQGSLMVQSFDPSTLKLSGEAMLVGDQITERATWAGFSSSRDLIAYRTGGIDRSSLVWFSRDGKRGQVLLDSGRYGQIALSPDGRRLAVEIIRERSNVSDIWTIELSTGLRSRLTFSGDARDPVWSPDSRRVAFEIPGAEEIREVSIGGTEMAIYSDGNQNRIDEWTPDGKSLIFRLLAGFRVFSLPIDPPGKPKLLLNEPLQKDELRISPDGRWIAYGSPQSGRQEIYIARFPDFAEKRQLSRAGGVQPQWRRDGRELIYLGLDGKLMAVDMGLGASGAALEARELFQTAITVAPNTHHYAVAPDAHRFLVREPIADPSIGEIKVMVNWQAGLKK